MDLRSAVEALDQRWSTSISHVPFLKLAMQPKMHKVGDKEVKSEKCNFISAT